MSKMKTVFELEVLSSSIDAKIKIMVHPSRKPQVQIHNITSDLNPGYFSALVKDKDLERFAVNILKALDSKKLTKP